MLMDKMLLFNVKLNVLQIQGLLYEIHALMAMLLLMLTTPSCNRL